MSNLVTDKMNFVKIADVRRVPLFNNFVSYPVVPIANFNQEVFRGSSYQGTVFFSANQGVPNTAQQVKVLNGDIIYRVNMLPQPSDIVGTLSTKDKYKRIYDWPVQLTVHDSFKFITEYLKEHDPVNGAIRTFKSWFEQDSQEIEHDKILNLKLPIDSWNKRLIEKFGIQIVPFAKPTFREDPYRTEFIAIGQEVRNRSAALERDAHFQKIEAEMQHVGESRQNEYQREEQAKKYLFDRQEETKKQIHSLRKKFRDAAANELISILKERIREGYERDQPMEKISSEYISLMDAFDENFHVGRENALFSGNFEDDIVDYIDDLNTSPNGTLSGSSRHTSPSTANDSQHDIEASQH